MVSYSISPDMVPGRLGLLVTLFLITSNVYGSVKAPESRGFSFIEIWMIGIQATISLAILEYAMVLILIRRANYKKEGIIRIQGLDEVKQLESQKNGILLIKLMDEWSLLGSATFFLLFNICYWVIAKMK